MASAAYYDVKYAEIPKDVLDKAVKYIRDNFTDVLMEEIKELITRDGLINWMKGAHHFWGMQVRNMLRSDANLGDDLLPDGNWDDYYIQVIEAAAGFRFYQLPQSSPVTGTFEEIMPMARVIAIGYKEAVDMMTDRIKQSIDAVGEDKDAFVLTVTDEKFQLRIVARPRENSDLST